MKQAAQDEQEELHSVISISPIEIELSTTALFNQGMQDPRSYKWGVPVMRHIMFPVSTGTLMDRSRCREWDFSPADTDQ